ncbi:MAG TPA: SPOR domain-containing protein, partial [Clostridia bacterium]|nr:SPOR domain-containing protein [Clostridia bacterium]
LPDKQDGEKDHVPRITETIKVEEMKFHAIQMGAFNDGENAKSIAEQLKTKGGAGYVLEDQYFRVMAMALLLESDALAVKEQLKTQEVEAQIYEINCPGVDMDITASSEKIEGIKSSFALLKESMEIVESIIKDLDKDKITLGSGMDKLGQIKSQMEAKIEQIDGYSVTQGGSQVLDGLKDVFVQETKNIDIIIKGNTSDKVAISSKIKYTYIDMIIRHKKYIEQISNG